MLKTVFVPGVMQQATGQHPLRERARKLDQGILVIRFEMPFNVWCVPRLRCLIEW